MAPPASLASEHLFSAVGQIYADRRNSSVEKMQKNFYS